MLAEVSTPEKKECSYTDEECISEDRIQREPSSTHDEQASSSFSLSNKELGRKGEAAAVAYLKRKGFEILATNWQCFAGEADIVAQDGKCICFVEVKTRTSIKKGLPSEAVDAKKRSRYEKIAACYLQENVFEDMRVRFDVISILVLRDDQALLRHYINAFGAA